MYTDGCISQNKAFAKPKQIQNTYLLFKIRLRTLIWLSSHLNLLEIGEKYRLTVTTPIYAILFGTWLGPSNMAAAPWLPASLLEPNYSIQSYLKISGGSSELYKKTGTITLYARPYDWMKPKFRPLEEAMYVWSEQNIVQNTVQWPARKLSCSGSTIVLEHITINQYVLHQ